MVTVTVTVGQFDILLVIGQDGQDDGQFDKLDSCFECSYTPCIALRNVTDF